ncbi:MULTISPECIES: invasion associated locus B family protein [unclassified Methylobacterium]|uniref:invasion associated locus B family protein n=1 Tax=unclassified Methylobacterium TaxID=2615210 RepID=UPI0006F94629|nr:MULTISPECIES: invasion associated locus B family protein [unclassified Methylobacterium]KQO73224.1 invasion protein [Methylobacterium sp. Leaf88]KQP68782.1 invasion protein [Methylobacterium sp. Leaf111]KQT81806.1 invasion protein [Methylobacterium sp. Leaf465]
MPSISLIRVLAVLSFALTVAAPVAAQDAEAPAATEAPAKPKPRKAAPPKPAPAKPAAPMPAAASAPPTTTAGWPTGASSLTEVYGDWTVTCAKADAKAECAVMQAQGAKGRREFALEIRTPNDGRAQGFILMPLGLAIEPGISFKLDEAVLGKGAPYLSCSQEGCLVPISLPTLATDTMKTAKNLLVSATKPEAKEPVTITVPLEGFANALARAIALTS